jgi:hypothetical protein
MHCFKHLKCIYAIEPEHLHGEINGSVKSEPDRKQILQVY